MGKEFVWKKNDGDNVDLKIGSDIGSNWITVKNVLVKTYTS